MKAKPRLVLEEGPAAPVGSRLALLPTVEKFASAFNDTADYFEYQRLSGRAPILALSLPGHEIAGLREWLARLLQVDVQVSSPLDNCRLRTLNFLEGMRSDLLKLGNQLFDFTGGRFVPSKLSPVGAAAKRTFEIKGGKDLAAAFKSLFPAGDGGDVAALRAFTSLASWPAPRPALCRLCLSSRS